MSKSPENVSLNGNGVAYEGPDTTRRGFLGGAAGATGAVLAAGALARTATSSTPADAAPLPTNTSRALLILDGVPYPLSRVSGGEPYAEVQVNEGELFDEKNPGEVLYEPIAVTLSGVPTKGLFEWIATNWKGSIEPKDGSIVVVDSNLKPVFQRNFTEGFLTETTVPECDGSSKDPAHLKLLITPTMTKTVRPSEIKGAIGSKQKMWLSSNFRLTIGGGTIDCKRVNKIDSFTVKQTVKELEIPNLVVSLAESSSRSWSSWFSKLVLGGNHEMEFEGSLEFMNPTGESALNTIGFNKLGIIRLSETLNSNQDSIRRVKAEMYCEGISLDPG